MANVEYLRLPTKEEGMQSRRARATQHVHEAIQSGDRSLKNLPVFLKEALETEAWKDRPTPLGKIVSNASFSEWLVAKYPHGVGASYEIVQNLLRDDPAALNLLDMAMQRKPGEDQERDSKTGRMMPKLNNIQERIAAPAGTSAAAGLRRLRKAANEGNAKAAHELKNVIEAGKSVHRACVDAGLRKEPDTLSKLKALWNKASQSERDAFDEWRESAAKIADMRAR